MTRLAAFGSDLYAAGIFGLAGGKSCYDLAHWNDSVNFDVPASLYMDKLLKAPSFFKFAVHASGIPSYVIDASSDLRSWLPQGTNTASFYEFYDFNTPAYSNRFYRVRSGP